jgi:phosphohistidine phosphatase
VRLVLVRHAIAEDREVFAGSGRDDASRPLTPEGRDKMRRGAIGLKELVPEIDALVSSPLKRAADTADIIARVYGSLTVERVQDLSPGTPLERALAWVASLPGRGTAVVVGHEPDLSRLVCALLASTNGPFLEFRKGAACLLEFTGPAGRGTATLDWFLGPKHLRRLGADRD